MGGGRLLIAAGWGLAAALCVLEGRLWFGRQGLCLQALRAVVNMGGIELGSSDKHTQNHTYPRIARNPELRGIRGGSLCQLNPAYKKTLFSSYEMGGGMHCAVQTLFRPCSDHVQT